MNEAAEEARRDLQSRARYVRALEGQYETRYESMSSSGNTSQWELKVSIAAENLPPPFNDSRPIDAGQIQSQMENISLAVEVHEESLTESSNQFFCAQTGVKPDYDRGQIRVTCLNTLNAPSREYLFALDDLDLDHALSSQEDTIGVRSSMTSLALIEGRSERVSAMNLRIASPFGKIFRVRLLREEN